MQRQYDAQNALDVSQKTHMSQRDVTSEYNMSKHIEKYQ